MILYRITLALLAPILAIILLSRWLGGRETRDGLAERLALGARPSDTGKVIWLHGASLGELTAARPLLEAILLQNPGVFVIATMNSYTGRSMVRKWRLARVEARMAPLDSRLVVRRFCKIWSPVALVSLENELWANRLSVCKANHIPALVAGGRMSDRAYSTWSRLPGLSYSVMSAISYLGPLDDAAARMFGNLGLDQSRIGSPLVLKSAVSLAEPDPGELALFRARFNFDQTILAASTHHGEDELILQAFVEARQQNPDLRLIIAPRHPERAAAIGKLVSGMNLTFDQRSVALSKSDVPSVLLADTLGEMPLWYSVAGITLIGGTWAGNGGHTPFEPAQFGSAIVHGPSIENHAKSFQALDKGNGAVLATDVASIARATLDLCNPERRAVVTLAADRALAPLRSAGGAILDFVEQLESLAEL